MKKFLIIFLLFLFSIGLNFYFLIKNYLLRKSLNSEKSITKIKVVKVIDGDTFEDENDRYRLYEIDAPEFPKGCLGENAKNRLSQLIEGKEVAVEKIAKDNFGRLLVYLYIDNFFINQLLIEEGLASYQKGKIETAKTSILSLSDLKSKKLKRGIYSSLCTSERQNCLIKGNYREADNTRIYHTPDCYNYDRITIRPNSSDRWFCSEEEAKKAGFVKSKDCPK